MLRLSLQSSCKVVTKDHRIPEKPTHRIRSDVATIFAIILQSCYKRSSHSRKTNTSHPIRCCDYLCNHLAKLLQRSSHSRKTNTSHQMLLLSFAIILQTLCSPNEDFGLPNERLGTHFRSTFQRREYSIWATFLWKVLRKCVPKCSFGLPKSSFGEHKLVTNIHVKSLWRTKKVALSALGENLLRKVVEKVDNAKITT